MERSELAEEKEMERSVSMRAEEGSSSSIKMVAEAEMLKSEPEKVGEESALAEKQCKRMAQHLIKGKESMEVDERDKQHDCSREKKVMEAEDETSSSSWMQMVSEAKMLDQDQRTIEEMIFKSSAEQEEEKVVEVSELAEEHIGSSSSSILRGKLQKLEDTKKRDSSSILRGKLQKLEDTGPSQKKRAPLTMKGKESLHDWVVEMKRIRDDRERWMRPSIYRVPDWLKSSMTKAEAYRPQVVSLGPFHHGEPSLGAMEEQKRRLMLHMVARSKQPRAKFVEAITEVADKLKDAYYGLDVGWRGHNTARLVDVMVTDGGFLLELMTTVRTGVFAAGYAPYDPIFSRRSLLSLWPRIRSDMLLVENQVPLLALKTLEAVRSGTSPSDAEINELVTDFICPKPKEIRRQEKLGLHPLAMLHRKFCGGHSQSLKHQYEFRQREGTMLSAEELEEAGVHFKRSDTRSFQDIDFKNGVLSMPPVEIGDSSERTFLNLTAFERLHSNAGSVATDYMIFLDNIIDSERDVALLRSKKVLKNFLSSDKAAADLFNILGKGATLSPGSKVGYVQWLVANHCEKPWPKLQASFKHTYLRTPWVFFSAVAAFILLALTILQTIYTVVPFYTKN